MSSIGETILKLTTPDKIARPEIIDLQNRVSQLEIQESDNVELATITAKGDLIVGTASGVVSRLAVGSNGYILMADSTQATGIKWADPTATLIAKALYNAKGSLIVATGVSTVTTLAIGADGYALLADSAQTAGVKWGQVTGAGLAAGAVGNTNMANMADATVKGRVAGSGTGAPVDVSAFDLMGIVKTQDGAGSGLDADLLDGLNSTAYAILAGQSGGQTLNGGTAASQNLTLMSTANATKGKILFGTSGYDEVNNRLGIGLNSPNFALDVSDRIQLRAPGGGSPGIWFANSAGTSETFVGLQSSTYTDLFGIYKNAYWRLSINSSGDVGIGPTLATMSGLTVTQAVTDTALGFDNVRMGTLGGTPRIILEDAGSTQWEIDTFSGALRFLQSAGVRATLNGSGNLDIIGQLTAATLGSGWTNITSFGTNMAASTPTPRCTKFGSWVLLTGATIGTGAVSAGAVLFTLPAGFRPAQTVRAAITYGTTATQMVIATNGDCSGPANSNGVEIYIGGVIFATN